ncbi:N-acetyltransferase family protein [Candidatus Halobeggiatoa sp. HSG11]|nr:N-acetyltransferase family protein [Candidatus Halobeggiatoa sp. HSG11]
MNIRIATISDLRAIVEIYNQAVAEQFCTADLEPVTIFSMQEWFVQHIPTKYPIFVAEQDSFICGWCSLTAHRAGRKALISVAEISFYIHTDLRKQGVGKKLITYTLQQAPKFGFKHLFALLLDVNYVSVDILKKHGFSEWGHLPEIADINGTICGQFIYGKKLITS